MDNWFAANPDKQYFEETYAEFVRDCPFDEWIYYLACRLNSTAEQRYQDEKNKIHGFGHEGIDGGADSTECLPGCRYYLPEGRIEAIEVLESYRGFQQFDEVYKTWKELDKNENQAQ